MPGVEAVGGAGLGVGALAAEALGAALATGGFAALPEPPQSNNVADAAHTTVIAAHSRTQTSWSSASPASPFDDNVCQWSM